MSGSISHHGFTRTAISMPALTAWTDIPPPDYLIAYSPPNLQFLSLYLHLIFLSQKSNKEGISCRCFFITLFAWTEGERSPSCSTQSDPHALSNTYDKTSLKRALLIPFIPRNKDPLLFLLSVEDHCRAVCQALIRSRSVFNSLFT